MVELWKVMEACTKPECSIAKYDGNQLQSLSSIQVPLIEKQMREKFDMEIKE
jgi:hypothetical protein